MAIDYRTSAFNAPGIIAKALKKTFNDRGFDVEVRHEYDHCMDQVVWAVIYGKQKETLRANVSDLKAWDRSKPVPFLGDGPELFIGPAEPKPEAPLIAGGTARTLRRIAP